MPDLTLLMEPPNRDHQCQQQKPTKGKHHRNRCGKDNPDHGGRVDLLRYEGLAFVWIDTAFIRQRRQNVADWITPPRLACENLPLGGYAPEMVA